MKTLWKFISSEYLWLLFIVIVGFWVRTYKIDSPIADWHSWRQADTAAVARNFYKYGFTPFIPKYDDMSANSDDLISNPGRFRFVEFPIYNSIVYFAYIIHGQVDETLARLVSVLFSLGSIIFVYLIAKKYFERIVGLLSAVLFAILPYNVYFSRVTLPEPTLVFFSLGMFYFTDKWIYEGKLKLYFISIIFAACALLIKPTAVFYMLPLAYSYFQTQKRWWRIPIKYFIWAFLAFAPLLLWRLWIMQFPEGIPASSWLLNGNGIRFRPAFWKWIIGQRMGQEILTVTGSSLFLLGIIIRPAKGYLLHLLAVSSMLYLIVFATGNVQHDYYQTLIVPILVIFAARGAVVLAGQLNQAIPRFWTIPLTLFMLILTIYLGWDNVQGLYQINNYPIVEAGKAADHLLPKNAVVVAPYNGDTAFLYQTNRPGWAVTALPLPEMITTYGVSAYVSTSKDAETAWVMRHFLVLDNQPNFVIADLTHLTTPLDIKDPEP